MADHAPKPSPLDEAARGRATLLRMLRFILVSLVVAVIGFYVVDIGENPAGLVSWEFQIVTGWPFVVGFAFVLAAGVIGIDVLTPKKKISTLSGVFLGLVAGALAAMAVAIVIDLVAQAWDLEGNRIISTIKVLFGVSLTYLAVSIVLQTQDDFRLIIPYVDFAKQIRGVRPMLLDTSVLIDSRIVKLAQTGLVQAPLIVPRFVIDELQRLADSSDRMKRTRGRRGLDTVTHLQRSPLLDVSIDETFIPGKNVDQLLVDLAKQMPATIVTNDGGLQRVARIHTVAVVNLHDVASALKPNVIPGETLHISLIKRGEQPAQGVGYLEDGTMVIAEDGAQRIGDDVTITVTSSMQTTAGKLIFGRINSQAPVDSTTATAHQSDDADASPAAPPSQPQQHPRSQFKQGPATQRNPRRS